MSEYYYRVYIDNTKFGHAFIEICGPNGQSEVWGYYPEVNNPMLYAPTSSNNHVLLGNGTLVRDDQWPDYPNGMHPSSVVFGDYQITKEEYDKMNMFIELLKNNPGYYNFLGDNCVEFVEVMMGLAGDRPFFWNSTAPDELRVALAIKLAVSKAIDFVRSIFGAGAKQGSPIVLDLDKDGIETTALTSGTYFDHDANGFSEQTGWASSDDGLLVMDKDADGLIEDGTELFGDNTLLANGTKASNGFQALANITSFRLLAISR